MTPIMIEAALRSLLVGLTVAVGLRAFRIRNVVARKAALGLVLVSALAMPALMRLMGHVQFPPALAGFVLPGRPLTLLEELQARILADGAAGKAAGKAATPAAESAATPAAAPAPSENASNENAPRHNGHPHAGAAAAHAKEHVRPSAHHTPAATTAGDSGQAGEEIQAPARIDYAARSLADLVLPSLTLANLAFSIYLVVTALLLVRLAMGLAVALRLWLTAAPIPTYTIPGMPGWLRMRASDRVSSPLTIGSGILLPADYETWDEEKLSVVLAHERSHIRQGDFYMQLLASLYAAVVWFSPLGWWLKRELADLAEAISDRAGIEEARSRTSYAQVLLEFAAAPRSGAMGVAMARSGNLSRRIERLLNDHTFRQCFPDGRRALVAVLLVPVALFMATALVRVEAATRPAVYASLTSVRGHHAPARTVETAATVVADQFVVEDEPGNRTEAPDLTVTSASDDADCPDVESASTDSAVAEEAATRLQLRAVAISPVIRSQSEENDAHSFDRTLSVGSDTRLIVNTGSGNIHLTRSSGDQIHVHGQIHLSHSGSEDYARQLASNPPIEQSGNVIRIGEEDEHGWRGISISYQIEAPAGTVLQASSGSGDIQDEGVGRDAKLDTGSGDIRASGLEGPFVVKTGSGNITAEATGEGDVKAETGSGTIEIKGIHGGFHGGTGSGDIKVTGTPSAPWKLETGSGNVEIWSENAPMTLDASTGSGSVTTDHEMLVKGSLDQHHIHGNLNGGGPLVRVETGSGDIHVH